MFAKTRNKPYHAKESNWSTIFSKPLVIPMNQRAYEWEEEQIRQVLGDIFYIFEETDYYEKMGSVIILDYDGYSHVYDGQQRMLTIILVLFSLSKMETRVFNRNKSILTVDTDMGFELTEKQKEYKEKYSTDIIPKIQCVSPSDMEALFRIFNNQISSFIDYVGNIEEIAKNEEDNEEEQKYKCSSCQDFTALSKSNFINHIKSAHEYDYHPTGSKLYEAYICIYNTIKKKNYTNDQLLQLNHFVLEHMDVQVYDSQDSIYVSRIFDWENNRGKSVAKLDVIKNQILVRVPDKEKYTIYSKWEELKKLSGPTLKTKSGKYSPIYEDYGQKLFDIAIQLYNNGLVERKPDYEKLFHEKIIQSTDILESLNEFFSIVEKLQEYMVLLEKNKFGKLLLVKKRAGLDWALYKWFYLPIFWKNNMFDVTVVEMVVKWYYRLCGFDIKPKSFSSIVYYDKIINTTNKILEGKREINYYDNLKQILKSNPTNSEKMIEKINIPEIEFSAGEKSRLLLCFLEVCKGNNKIDFLDVTLEHIISQKSLGPNKHFKNNLGNLTLLSTKDNSSCSTKEYNQKKKVYEKSNFNMTKEIVEDFQSNFTVETIKIRCENLENDIKAYTNYM